MNDSSIFVPYGEEPAPSPQPITVFCGPTESRHSEVYITAKPGWVFVGKRFMYSSGKQKQRAGMWLSSEEAKALREVLAELEDSK